jgi:hypothetical protein
MKKTGLILVAVVCFILSAHTQGQAELTLHMKNGDVITGKSDLREISFKTDFGTLVFPIDQVNSIHLGLQDSRFDKANLLNLLDKIENGKDKEREKAFDEIFAMDEGAIPFIKAYLKASETTGTSATGTELNIQTLYEVMLAKHKVSRNYSLYDILVYKDEFRVEGSYSFASIFLDTKYGRLKIERNSIERIEVKLTTDGIASRNSFKLYANQHISGNKDDGWLNTGILVKKGQTIEISAGGQIMLASLSGNTYTPDGGINGSPGPADTRLTYGQVAFKIGQGDDPQRAADNFSGVAERTGIIYLSIFETVFNSANSGYYTINVEVK